MESVFVFQRWVKYLSRYRQCHLDLVLEPVPVIFKA